jgi:cytochrome P450
MTHVDDAPPIVLDEAFIQDRLTRYQGLRRAGPVHPAVLPDGLRVWLVTRYEVVHAALTNPSLSKDSRRAAPLHERRARERDTPRAPFPAALNTHMLNTDPPDHTRLRKLVGKAFTARRVALLRPRIEEITAELLDELATRDEADLLSSFAFPLPLAVICELFGVPENDRAQFRQWSDSIGRYAYTHQGRDATFAMADYLSDLAFRRRRHPEDDMLTALVRASDDEDRLSEDEVVAMAFLLLTAGHETTAHLIGNGVFALLDDADQLAALRADPALVPSAIEEFLRYLSPSGTTTLRFTTAPTKLGEVEIPEGEFVVMALESANRDQARFDDADRLDVGREHNAHLAFGHGLHHCLGAPLARLEGQIAIKGLLERFPDLALATDPAELRWRDSLLFRGLENLPVRLVGTRDHGLS